MSFAKTQLFSQEHQLIAFYARALCHPARIIIIKELFHQQEMNVSELTKILPLSRSSVSQHLQILRNYDFVSYIEDYPIIFYRLKKKNVRKALTAIHSFDYDFSS
jgi:DNA-binding transcriptional ArsR family regulator